MAQQKTPVKTGVKLEIPASNESMASVVKPVEKLVLNFPTLWSAPGGL